MGAISVQVFQAVVAGAAGLGVAPPRLLSASGIDAATLADPDARLSRTLEARLWHEAARLTADDAFGVHLAERLPVDALGALGYAVRSSATVGQAIARVMRFMRVMADGPRLSLTVGEARALVRHTPPHTAPEPSRHAVEFLLASLVMLVRHGVDEGFVPLVTRFRHAPPKQREPHVALFGATLEFGAEHDELVLDSAMLARPQRHAEPSLAGVLDAHLAAQLAALPAHGATVIERARAAIAAELDQGEPTLEAVAARLHMSPRSLQRKLHDEGRTLSRVLDELRADLAQRWLDETRESIGEVAFRLGFSDVTTFHRAFKRWTGQTPAAYRRGPSVEASRV